MDNDQSLHDPGVMEVTGRVLIATIVALVVVLILVFLFHLYAKWLWHRRQQAGINNPNNRRSGADQHSGVTVLRRGLDAAFLKTLPIVEFNSDEFKDGIECSVCLSEIEQGEKTRVLPKCNHLFHAECIDMWFHSHSTCPICRNPVSDQTEISVESLLDDHEAQEHSSGIGDLHNFPTNVLFWGDETEVSTLTSQLVEANNNNHQGPILPFEPAPSTSSSSSSSSSASSSQTNNDRKKPDLVIDIPRQVSDENDERTPIMRSLRRILSSSRRFNPFSPGSEQVQS